MFATAAALLRKTGEFWMRELLLGIGMLAALLIFALGSLGFVTYAAYVWLRVSQGQFEAALIVAAVFALMVVLIATIQSLRQRARRSFRHDESSTPAAGFAPAKISSSWQRGARSQAALYQAMLSEGLKLGRDLSPMQLLVIALASGVVAGRILRK